MTKTAIRCALLALTFTLALSAFAKPRSENVTLFHDATINGTNLPAGDYVVKYDVDGTSAQVKFTQRGKEVATAKGQVKTLPKKAATNQVIVNNEGRSITEIDFGGKDTALTFGASSDSAGK